MVISGAVGQRATATPAFLPRVHPIGGIFHPKHFHPSFLSSQNGFIPKQFHPKTFSSKKRFLPKNLCQLDLPLPGPPSPGPRKISLLSRHNFHYFFPLLGGLLVGIVGAVQGRIPHKMRVWASLEPFCENPSGLQVSTLSGSSPFGPFQCLDEIDFGRKCHWMNG